MSVGKLIYYNSEGLMRDCYVYMLFCQDNGPIYIKVGLSHVPLVRLDTLRTSCPVTAKLFAYIPVHGKRVARRLERALHDAFEKWRTNGEWFQVTEKDKEEFNILRKRVTDMVLRDTCDKKWNSIYMAEYLRRKERNARFAKISYMRRGPAYRDFLAACK